MRGRPARELLRQSAPLVAVVAVLVVAPVAAGAGPQPDRAPAESSTLAPDPVPGTVSHASAPAKPPVSRHPVATPSSPTQSVAPKTVAAVHPRAEHPVARRPAPKPAPPSPPSRFLLPRIALPAVIAADPVRAPRDLDAVLAGVALLLAAATAGSGARLVSVWNRRAGAGA